MKASYETKENSRAELRVTVDGEKWTQANEKAFKKIAGKVQLKGFRAGKAPLDLVRKQVSEREIWMEAIDLVAQEALEYGLQEYPDIRLVDRPTLDVEGITASEAKLVFGLTVYPEVKLGDYKAVKYSEEKVSVLKKDVDVEIQHLREQHAEEVLKEDDSAVKNGDIAVIDFEGFVDGVAFDGGKGTEYPLEIGSGSFIPGFEEQIIGMKAEEEKDITVTFPENYGAKELAGKEAVFHVKVDGIKEKVLPELNDEFVAEVKLDDSVKTVDDLQKYLKEQMTNQRKAEAEENATNKLLDELSACCSVDVPQVMIDSEVEDTFNTYVSRIQQQGISLDMYYRIMGTDEKGFKEQLIPEAEKKVRIRLILEAIADDMGIKPTETDVEDEYKAMAEEYKMEVEKIKELVPASYLSDDLKMRMALDSFKKSGKPAEKKAKKTEEEPAKKPARKSAAKKAEKTDE
ncbi:MAG: trigger factor [Erysipelotrichaceae bacterium]|nr:trigger factor [Erysipelotrichaceae bacterium]